MAWKTIPIKSKPGARGSQPTFRFHKENIYLSKGAYDLLAKDMKADAIFFTFLFNDEAHALYITQTTPNAEGALRVTARSKHTRADLLEKYLHNKYGKVNRFSIDNKAIMRDGNKTFMISPIKGK